MYHKISTLTFFALFLSVFCFSQTPLERHYGGRSGRKPQIPYLATDSTMLLNVVLVAGADSDNARFIREKKGEIIITHAPDKISEYGLSNGRVYKAFTVNIDGAERRLFFERLVYGRVSLYFLMDRDNTRSFYVAKGQSSELVLLPERKQDYMEILRDHTQDCSSTQQNVAQVRLTKNNLIRFLNDYQRCTPTSTVARVKYGVVAGVSINKLSPMHKTRLDPNPVVPLTVFPYENFTGIFVSGMLDVPFRNSAFSFTTAPAIHNYTYVARFQNTTTKFEMRTKQTRLNLPINFRYTYFKTRHCPFLEAGPFYSYGMNDNSVLYKYPINKLPTSAQSVYDRKNYLTRSQVGYSVAVGAMLRYNQQVSYVIHAGYNKSYPTNTGDGTLAVRQFLISAGVLF